MTVLAPICIGAGNINLVKKIGETMFDKVSKIVGSKPAIIAAAAMLGTSVFAQEDSIKLPEIGINVAGYATAAITALGTVAAVAVGGYVAFLLVRKGLSWLRRI